MSSVNIDGRDYKRCMRCGEWTDYADLMYVPPTKRYDKAEDDRLHDALTSEPHPDYDDPRIRRIKDDDAAKAYGEYHAACFGLDVCPACGVQDAHRAPTVTVRL